ncbi:MAG TPA: RNA polymerase sigma factor RpoD/SigA [Bacillota bacterium]|nr:RNA polymerase sigma factor RpoD/SigA [Bacillota bacterium]
MNDFVVQLYLRDLSTESGCKPRAEALLAGAGGFDDSAREQLVLGNLDRVVRMAWDYRNRGLPLGDLINEGNIGLMRAARRFDPLRQVRFTHYAKPWIQVQMQRAVSYQAWPVSLPADFSWRRGQVRGAEERLSATLHREPNDSEVAKVSGLKVPAVRRLRATPTPSFVPLDSPVPGEDPGLTLAEIIPDETSPTPYQEAAHRNDQAFVARLLATLTPCEQRVIRLRFGLDDGCERTLQEVGQMLGYVRQGIHRIECAALAKLRRHARFQQLAQPQLTECSTPPSTAGRCRRDDAPVWAPGPAARLETF